MSDGTIKPKKQFKSQSVNDLFRQQLSANNNPAQSGNVGPKDAFLRRSKSPGATKLKLVTKKIRTINTITNSKVSTKKTSSASSSPSPDIGSTLSAKITPGSTDKVPEIDPIEKLPETLSINNEKPVISTQSSSSSIAPNKSRFNWNDSSRSNSGLLWNEIQNKIDDTVPEPRSQSLNNAFPPDSSMTWSSPNSKISSFRKSVGTPLQSFNQSPLARPMDYSANGFFQEINNSPYSIQSRQNSEITDRPSDNKNESLWSSPNIWNSTNKSHIEERQLSTKSDSAIPWSPFDSDPFTSNEPLRQHSQNGSQQQSTENFNRFTSRFFPSPAVPQTQMFDLFENHAINDPNGVFRSTFDESSTMSQRSKVPSHPSQSLVSPKFNSPIPQQLLLSQPFTQQVNQPAKQPGPLNHQLQNLTLDTYTKEMPKELIPTSSKAEREMFPNHFEIHTENIPVSVPRSSGSSYRSSKKSYYNELPHYPEGFSSTFYKRGINNFMFIRELQPKIMTSKFGDSVEVRLTFPSIESNSYDEFQMKSDIVDIDIRDLEGKLGGLKVNKPPGNFPRKHFNGRSSHRGGFRRG